MRVLFRNGIIYANGPQPLTSMLIADDRILWIGADVVAHEADRVVDLDGRVVTPAFVDAHVHTTASGIAYIDCETGDPRRLLERFSGSEDVVLGHGWDDTGWPANWFRIAELDARVGDTPVYASRIDVHSAFVSSALLAEVPSHLDGWSASGILSRAAHAAARAYAFGHLSDEQRSSAQQRTLTHAVRAGIACLQEMAGPQISSVRDAELLVANRSAADPEIVLWWGELHGHERAAALGAHGIGGDLVVDGSLGSRTAALCAPYTDSRSTGILYQSDADLVGHITEAARRAMPTAFHAIGDAATNQIVQAFRSAADVVGAGRIGTGGHRIEHCELIADTDLRLMAELGIIASMQPQFDAIWGGDSGMYQRRLGDRATRMNRFATMSKAGVQLAFGSDSPVTPMAPWDAVHAAQHHHCADERLGQRAAIAAHTRGGWRAIGVDDAGQLAEGWQATFAVWEPDGSPTVSVDDRIARWSTDPRAGIPLLPDMRQARCVMTVHQGRTLFDALT